MKKYHILCINAVLCCAFLITVSIISYNTYTSRSIDREEQAFKTSEYIHRSSDFSCDGKSPAFLLIHGFSNTPYDMKPVATQLERMGYAYKAMLLPGHGVSPRLLRKATAEEWLEKAEMEYNILKSRYGSVSVVGFSIGGAIALDIASRKNVGGLVLISPFFKITDKWFYFGAIEWLARKLNPVLPYLKKTRLGPINDPEKLKHYHSFWHLPLACIGDVTRIGRLAAKKSRGVACDTLWLHSKGDNIADFDASREVFQRLAATDKLFVEFKKSDHVILYDYDTETAVDMITAFIRGDKKQPPSGEE
jgi:carboxylesterase